MKKFTLYFILVNLFFASFYLDTWQNANTTSRVLPVLSVVDLGTMKIDSFADKTIDKSVVDGHYYLDKAPLPSFVIIPFYALLKASGVLAQGNDFDNYSKPVFLLGSFICGSLPFVLICLLLFQYGSHYTNNYRAAVLSMLFLYGSFVFIFSGTFFAHVFSSCLLLLSYIFIKEKHKYFYSGLFLGLAFLSEYPIAFILPIWAIQIYINEQKLKSSIVFLLGVAPFVLCIMIYNYIIMGSPFDSLYGHLAHKDFIEADKPLGFALPEIHALWGITFSVYRGLFIYCPVLLFAIVFFFKEKIFTKINWLKNYLGIITIIYFLLISSYNVWWGGWSFGPRQLMPIGVLLLFEALVFFSKKQHLNYLLWPFLFVFVAVMWVVKSTVVYSVPTEIKDPFKDYFFQNMIDKNINPNNILTMMFGVQPLTANIIWLILFSGISLFFIIKMVRRID
jgi:hypothetical protein